MVNRAHSAAYYFYMARRVRGAYATDCERQAWYQLLVDAAGVAAVDPHRPLVTLAAVEDVLTSIDMDAGDRKYALEMLRTLGVTLVRSCPATRPGCPHSCTKHDCDALAAGVKGRKP